MTAPENEKNRRDFLTGWGETIADSLVPPDGDDQRVSPERLPRDEVLHQFSRPAMGCEFQLLFAGNPTSNLGAAAMAAFDEIERLEELLSIYRSTSEVWRFNNAHGKHNVTVSEDLANVLELALEIAAVTGGAYDPTATPLARLWGFLDRRPRLPDTVEIEQTVRMIGWHRIRLHRAQRVVTRLLPLELNFNSIGKGYAVERAAEVLRRHGIERFVIHGGQSSVVARNDERNPDDAWTIGLTHPLIPKQRIGEVRLRNQALSTSGTARQGFVHRGKRLGHILDPRTGYPPSHHLMTTVIHADAAVCDALTTAFFVMPTSDVIAYCRGDTSVKAIIFTSDDNGKSQREPLALNFGPNELRLFD